MPPSETSVTTTGEETSDSQPPPPKKHGKGEGRRSGSQGRDKKEEGERKLLPPPPIIGPDGKEIPRPRDAAGRPLPIYVNSEGKPILDENGKPIPLKFGEDGKPIPLEGRRKSSSQDGGGNERPVVVVKKEAIKIPEYVIWAGAIDLIISAIVGIYYAYKTSTAYKEEKDDKGEKLQLAITTVLLFVAALTDGLPYLAVKKNKKGILWAWAAFALIFFLGQIGLCVTLPHFLKNSIFGAVVYHGIRLAMTLIMICMVSGESSSNADTVNHRYITTTGAGGYPRGGGGGGPQTIVVQQPTVVPAYYPAYGGYYGGGYYGGATDAALLGFAAGSMLGHGYYGGYGMDYGWGGGWGGGWGYDDGFYGDYGW